MKKYLILAAAATLAACNNETLVDIPNQEAQEVAISFGTGFNNMTRGAENSDAYKYSALETYHNNFQVWGYKFVEELLDDGSLAETYLDVFSGTDAQSKVYRKDDDWYYSPARFWDKSADYYDYFAAAPYNDAKWEIHLPADNAERYQKAYLTYEGAEIDGYSLPLASKKPLGQPDDKFNTNDGTGKDLLIANDIRIKPSMAWGSYSSDRVHFYFNHILSRLNIAVKVGTTILEDPSVQVKLQEVKVYNMPSKGDFDESLATGDVLSAGTTTRWENLTSPYTVGFPNNNVKPENAGGLDVTADYQYVYQGLVIPQVVKYQSGLKLNGTNVTADTKPYLNIKYTINGEKFNYFYNLAEVLCGTKYLKDSKNRTAYKTTIDNEYAYTDNNWEFFDRFGNSLKVFQLWNKVDDRVNCFVHFITHNIFSEIIYYDKTTKKCYLNYDPTAPEGEQLTGEYTDYDYILDQDEERFAYKAVLLSEVKPDLAVPTADVPFNEGWQNNLKITINPTNIKFDADVYEWATDYDYNYDIE